jgi:enoyl-CoA hydratase/carnithine racemase
LEVDGAVARITLTRPERRNAQTPSTWLGLAAIGAAIAPPVRVVVVRGEGPSFSAGLDRRMFTPEGIPGEGSVGAQAETDPDEAAAVIAGYQSGFSWLRRPDIVSVAAVQGHAVGAGFQLALACDLRIAADDAQFTMAETSLGLVPDLGGTQVLVEAVGYARALEICATGRRVGAAEAERLGLAGLVVPGAELDAAVDDLVAALLAPPEGAVPALKELLLAASQRSYGDQLRAERTAQVERLRAMLAGH